jgi:hypothetical protein
VHAVEELVEVRSAVLDKANSVAGRRRCARPIGQQLRGRAGRAGAGRRSDRSQAPAPSARTASGVPTPAGERRGRHMPAATPPLSTVLADGVACPAGRTPGASPRQPRCRRDRRRSRRSEPAWTTISWRCCHFRVSTRYVKTGPISATRRIASSPPAGSAGEPDWPGLLDRLALTVVAAVSCWLITENVQTLHHSCVGALRSWHYPEERSRKRADRYPGSAEAARSRSPRSTIRSTR